ncbi:MAG TPA: ABC transporter ATP-binding protein [Candidatus Onthoplasma faecipullorum]|mgnify:CR=1 FL=1|nr:ABC transporter ATP-binding protein [Candidatus Onthoplasma faecipullorum]
MLPVLKVEGLTKTYGKKNVVDDVTFSVFAGQIFGFVGPNGAGKSTTIRMITGLTPITKGSVRIAGYSVQHAFKNAISRVGAVVEMPQLYSYMSGLKNLKLFAGFYGKKAVARIPNIVKLVGLENRIKDKVSTYSLGMKQRLGIAQALLNKPELLILDEPTNGLDPNGIVEMRNILRVLAEHEKMAIIISSHNLAELEQICDVIGVINDGKLIEYKTMEEISQMVEDRQRVQLLCNYPNYAALLIKQKFNLKTKVVGNSVIAPIKERSIASIISYLTYKKIKIYGIKKIQKSLEELYFEILNNKRTSTSII